MELIREEFIQGKVLLIDKDYKWTSFDVINKIRLILNKKLNIKKIKVGHAGTLDPLATGLLLICTGKATKLIDSYLNLEKEYYFTLKLGETTPSFDLETETDKHYSYEHVNKEMISEILNNYTGEILQVPPLYSAKYIQGKRAYEYARKGQQVNIDPVNINIKEFKLLSYNKPYINFRIICSKGTYIRALARDISKDLKSGAHITELRRTAIGDFKIENASSIKEFEENIKLKINETFTI